MSIKPPKLLAIDNEPEDEDDELSISLEPGDYMAFYEPWDSGDYDT